MSEPLKKILKMNNPRRTHIVKVTARPRTARARSAPAIGPLVPRAANRPEYATFYDEPWPWWNRFSDELVRCLERLVEAFHKGD